MPENEHISFLSDIIKGIVVFPDELKIEEKKDEMGILLRINVCEDDVGKVLGHHGETANALRRIMRAYGFCRKKHISLLINNLK